MKTIGEQFPRLPDMQQFGRFARERGRAVLIDVGLNGEESEMNQRCRKLLRGLQVIFVAAAAAPLVLPADARGDVLTLSNGMQLEGKIGKIAKIGQDPLSALSSPDAVDVKQIVIVDDEMRRTFVPSKMVAAEPVLGPGAATERIKIEQRVAAVGRRIGSVGPIIRITAFDEWGRRIISMNSAQGRVDVVQGITLVTPHYCKVEGLLGRNGYVWDMRIATSSIPRETLSKILLRALDPKSPEDRLKIVRLYIQAERYQDAQEELVAAIEEFPKLAALEDQVKALRQFGARKLLQEIELRREAGQHALAIGMLTGFPAEGVAGETLLKVREILAEYEKVQQQGERVLQLLDDHLAKIEDEGIRRRIAPVHKELHDELNINTLDRMADFLRLADDDKLKPDQKLALAVSGWLLGSGSGTENIAVALSLVQVRDLVRDYLRTKPHEHHERAAILDQLKTMEGSDPENVAKLIAHMRPPIETAVDPDGIPGLFTLSVPGLPGEPDFQYHVQLPPQYDPYRRYPCIVTLNGAGTTPMQQIDWWTGDFDKDHGMRMGQATRRGYIVIAPVWTNEHQREYEYSAREHAAVLYSLRDACRRTSIDTDRVFLTGHSMGGDAAWDIGLAHPDLWAGVLPIVATADKYVTRYWENARDHLPMYFVGGELDGDRMSRNSQDLNRYLQYRGYDVTIVEYQGRGHEHFHDEILRMFQWMELPSHRRRFNVREFECVSMRESDNFYWWVEVDNFPPSTMVRPLEWPKSGVRAATTEAKALENNGVSVTSAGRKITLWLTPDIVDFDQRVTINRRSREVKPDIEVMLEDVRTRGDRQHPFWAKVEID